MSNKILFQSAPAPDNAMVTAATVPAGKERDMSLLSVTNLSDPALRETPGTVRYKLHIVKAGESPDTKNCLAFYPLYQPGESVHEYKGIRMSAGDKIILYNNAGRLAIQGFGEETLLGQSDLVATALQSIAVSQTSIAASQTTIAACGCP